MENGFTIHKKQARRKTHSRSMLTVEEVATAIHVHPNTIRHWSDQGLIKAYRIGPRRDRRFNQQDINSFVSQWHESLDSDRPGRGKVLIVGNDRGVTDLLLDIIQQQGYEGIAAETCERAINQIEKCSFDLILLDLSPPQFSGDRELQAIRDNNPETMVAVLIANGDDHMALKAISKGGVFLIRKPFDVTDINHVMHVAMRAHAKA
ncbi:hypothetical protein ES703_92242 [subsurface metagenome]